MARAKDKIIKHETTVQAAVDSAVEDIVGLRDEVQAWREGLEGTNLEQSDRYSTLTETEGMLDNADYAEFEIPEPVGEIALKITTTHKRYRTGDPRWKRLENACTFLSAAVSAIGALDDPAEYEDKDEDDRPDDLLSVEDYELVTGAKDELEALISDVEGAEFPRMFG